jgi:hypothetical protein
MTSARPLFFALLIAGLISAFSTSALAADEKAQQTSSSQANQATEPALFGRNATDLPASDLFFLRHEPRVSLTSPLGRKRSAVLNDSDCYTMRMYKVKRREHFAAGESGLRGYTTCELATNYQVHSAIAHVQSAKGRNAQIDLPEK